MAELVAAIGLAHCTMNMVALTPLMGLANAVNQLSSHAIGGRKRRLAY